jgi:predicted metal-dependent peptidase
VDTSASITDEQLSIVMDEIGQCLLQMGNFEAKISFFDTSVTEPILFHDRKTLKKAKINLLQKLQKKLHLLI